MLTSKERAYLRSLSNKVETIFQIGKDGVTDNVVKSIDEALTKRELIKVRVLESALVPAKDMIEELASLTGAEPVAAIGSRVVLYRQSEAKIIVLPR